MAIVRPIERFDIPEQVGEFDDLIAAVRLESDEICRLAEDKDNCHAREESGDYGERDELHHTAEVQEPKQEQEDSGDTTNRKRASSSFVGRISGDRREVARAAALVVAICMRRALTRRLPVIGAAKTA